MPAVLASRSTFFDLCLIPEAIASPSYSPTADSRPSSSTAFAIGHWMLRKRRSPVVMLRSTPLVALLDIGD
ncbi:hypothetical protein FD724_38425 (plasmid) [Nostoc sp. C057]|uniref:hypothetical protein n=1 Tax=Nostoc sp. C057 TaxID=2576903 RepID=UPI0015C3380B|nr:hypothetical protein [Nostoc sp. C057]QLE53732.1 hypothetical protein FD724_38425 [Nostoc sp. C057]